MSIKFKIDRFVNKIARYVPGMPMGEDSCTLDLIKSLEHCDLNTMSRSLRITTSLMITSYFCGDKDAYVKKVAYLEEGGIHIIHRGDSLSIRHGKFDLNVSPIWRKTTSQQFLHLIDMLSDGLRKGVIFHVKDLMTAELCLRRKWTKLFPSSWDQFHARRAFRVDEYDWQLRGETMELPLGADGPCIYLPCV